MSESRRRGGRRGFLAPAAVVAMVAVALTAVGFGVVGLARPQAAPVPFPPASSTHKPLGRSAPVRLTIPSISVDSRLQPLGLDTDTRTVRLPRDPARAGWYERGATPGEAGPTIVVGYIARHHQDGVFGRLAALRTGARVGLQRADGTLVVYSVDRIASYRAHEFPVAEVYAPTSASTLRIITCGGALRPGQQRGNVVVYGHQLAVHR